MTKISGNFKFSGKFQDNFKISEITDDWDQVTHYMHSTKHMQSACRC